MKSKGFSLQLPVALRKGRQDRRADGSLDTGPPAGQKPADIQPDADPSLTSFASLLAVTSVQPCELLLERTQMQLEDVLSCDMRKMDCEWQDESRFDIPESPVLREDEIPSSPATSPPQLKRMEYLLENHTKTDQERLETWQCTNPDLLSLQLSLSSLIDSSRNGEAISSLISIGPYSIPINVVPYCPAVPPFLKKSTIASSVSRSVSKREERESTLSPKASAYITQLENELLHAETLQSAPISLICPHTTEETDWQQTLDEALSRLSLKHPTLTSEPKTHNRVKSAFVEVNRLKTATQTQLSDLNSAVLDLKRVEEEYRRAATALAAESNEFRCQIQRLQRENRIYREKMANFAGKLRETVRKAVETAESAPLICPVLSTSSAASGPDPSQIETEIRLLEGQLSQAAAWQRPKIEVKLTLLRNQLLRICSNIALSQSRESSVNIAQKTAVLHTFLSLSGKSAYNKRKLALSVCNTPRNNETFAGIVRKNGENYRKDTSLQIDLEGFEKSGMETDRSTVENAGRLAMTSRNRETDAFCAKNRLKMTEMSSLEAEIKAEKATLQAFSELLSKKDRELSEKEEVLMQTERNLAKGSFQAQNLTVFQEKYTKLVKSYVKKDRKVTEDLLSLRKFEEELIQREMKQNRDKEELKSLVSMAEERISALEMMRNEVVSMCSSLQSIDL